MSKSEPLEDPGRKRPLAEIRLDEETRPSALRIPGATEAHRERGRHLADIHRMYLAEIAQVGQALEHVASGARDPAEFANAVQELEMARNYRVFGTLCGRQCHVLTIHHTIEDRQIFPVLAARGDDGLRAVVARLQQEHLVVHELIERLEDAATSLRTAPSPEGFSHARDVFRALERIVRSHFRYEETELEEALGFHAVF